MAKTKAASKQHILLESESSAATLIPISAVSSMASNPEHNGHMVSPDEIRLAAYLKWEAAGKPDGDGLKFWSEAEQELQAAK